MKKLADFLGVEAISKSPQLIFFSLFLLIVLTLGSTLQTQATPYTFSSGNRFYAAPNGKTSGSCDSWENACSLQHALSLASDSDEIWVRKGVHYPGTARTDSFTLKNGVALYGGFDGTENDRAQRDWQVNLTVLSGDIDQNDVTDPGGVVTTTENIIGANSFHVITATNVISTTLLDGFVVTAGQADGAFPHDSGGGMYNDKSNPTLIHVTFSGNAAAQVGGGMYNRYSSPIIIDTVFVNNEAARGGGIYNYKPSSPSFESVIFRGNIAVEHGGGMYNWSSHPVLTDTLFDQNTAAAGGGIYNEGSNLEVANTTFISNTATVAGGVYNLGGSPTFLDVLFKGNQADHDGGGMANNGSAVTLTNAIFMDNVAGFNGGGIHNGYSNPQLTNVAFFNNAVTGNDTTGFGGGMFNWDSSPNLVNVTFGGNTALRGGGGLCNYNNSNATIVNAILWHNHSSNGGLDISNLENSQPEISHSNIGGCGGSGSWNNGCGIDGGGNIDTDPLFVALATGNLRLQANSPCIDRGDNNALPAGITIDLDHNPRISGVAVDIGAYEFFNKLFLPLVLLGGR